MKQDDQIGECSAHQLQNVMNNNYYLFVVLKKSINVILTLGKRFKLISKNPAPVVFGSDKETSSDNSSTCINKNCLIKYLLILVALLNLPDVEEWHQVVETGAFCW